MRQSGPIEVAIIGGGCAGIAAAFELTRPEHRGRYHVTVYQQGWRLGGKGASGRGPADRIEEHGFHVWLGFYENSFRLLRECYAERNLDGRPRRFTDWQDAFVASPDIGLAERSPNGAWSTFMAHFPGGEGMPGDPLSERNPFSVAGYLRRTVSLLQTLLVACQNGDGKILEQSAAAFGSVANGDTPAAAPNDVTERVGRLLKYGMLATMAALVEATTLLEVIVRSVSRYPQNVILQLIDAIGTSARSQLEALAERDAEIRRLWEIIDIVLATIRGIVRSGLVYDRRGFDAIDDYDCRDWLRENGASQRSLDSSFVRGLHGLAFAHEDGDFGRPSLAAGAALRGSLRMFFTYRGALFWKMRAGMGDVVFAPFYEVLKRRGVTFRFFHRLENVQLTDPSELRPGERPHVRALEFDVQAEVTGGVYEPLIDVQGLPCWPSKPDYAQLADGDRLERENWDFESFWDRRTSHTKTLRVVDDFDAVVLAVGIGAIPHVCKEILARDQRWRDMVARVKTAATQAFQIWLRESSEELGWRYPLSSISGFTHPFDTWADMAHLLGEERWPNKPRGLAYFCSVLPDEPTPPDRSNDDYLAKRHDEVRRNAILFLERDIRHLWPRAVRAGGGFRWELLVDPASNGQNGDGGEARFASQFWKANVNPSDRYTLALPGSARYRISPLDNSYDNLTIAGDWTNCGHNTGCVESAFMSGRLAAHALCGHPALESIIGYDHP